MVDHQYHNYYFSEPNIKRLDLRYEALARSFVTERDLFVLEPNLSRDFQNLRVDSQ